MSRPTSINLFANHHQSQINCYRAILHSLSTSFVTTIRCESRHDYSLLIVITRHHGTSFTSCPHVPRWTNPKWSLPVTSLERETSPWFKNIILFKSINNHQSSPVTMVTDDHGLMSPWVNPWLILAVQSPVVHHQSPWLMVNPWLRLIIDSWALHGLHQYQ